MEKLATDIYSFQNLRKSGYTYVDKTALILPLANDSIGRHFLLFRAAHHCRREGRLMTKSVWSLFAGLTLGVALVSVGAESAANECA